MEQPSFERTTERRQLAGDAIVPVGLLGLTAPIIPDRKLRSCPQSVRTDQTLPAPLRSLETTLKGRHCVVRCDVS
jgi:hypothetical protein